MGHAHPNLRLLRVRVRFHALALALASAHVDVVDVAASGLRDARLGVAYVPCYVVCYAACAHALYAKDIGMPAPVCGNVRECASIT